MKKLFPFLGLNVNGDMGGLTFYTRRDGKQVAYPVAPPLVPASPLQKERRDAFRTAMTAWRSLPEDERRKYREVCDLLGLCMLGHNLFINLRLHPDPELLRTLQQQSGIVLQ